MTGTCPINLGFCPKEFYLSYNGRISRKDFWWKFLVPVMFINIILEAIFPAGEGEIMSTASGIFFIIILWPSIVVLTKRLHDLNKSGWWQLLYMIPLLGAIWMIVEQGILKGTDGDNKFGSNPIK